LDYGWSAELEDFKREVRALVKKHAQAFNTGQPMEGEGASAGGGPAMDALRAEMDERGWRRMSWPREYGGDARSPWYQYIMVEEMSYGGIPSTDLSVGSVLPAIMNHGTDAQKQKYVPDILAGKIRFCIGYSEPNAGSDLASLQTRATRDGDDWVINGQKLWTTGAHTATHVWLAARTNPEAPKHRGISMLIVPMETPGITVQPLATMGGGRTNQVFYDNVRVPSDALVGEVDRGWYITANALDHERVTIAPLGGIVRRFDDFVSYLKAERPDVLQDQASRARLAEMKVDLHVQRALKLKNAAIIANGGTPNVEASMTKVWSSELQYRMASLFMDLLGREGALMRDEAVEAPLDGSIGANYQGSPVLRFGGGTNEIQRNIIAQRGLGLAR
jgi:alkylation response protein AidB-like acyl-CoA dehydrogenase